MAEKKIKDLMAQIKNLRIACTILLVILLIGAIVLSVGFGVYGKNTEDWFKKQEQQAEQLPYDGEQEGGQLIETIQCQGVMLASAGEPVALSDGSITKTLTARVQPEGADATFDWDIAWKNASSTWASGKALSSYMTMKVSDDTKSVDLVCPQAFGEQIIVTATSIADSSKSAQCTLDYEKRIVDVTIDINEKTAGALSAINFSDSALEYTFTATPTYGVGTITPTGTPSVTYKFTDAFRNAINYSYTFASCVDAGIATVDASTHDIADTLVMKNWQDSGWVIGGAACDLGWETYNWDNLKKSSYNSGSTQTSVCTTVITAQKQALKSYSGNVLEFSYSFTSANGIVCNLTKYVGKGTAEFSSLNVSSVSLNSNLVF